MNCFFCFCLQSCNNNNKWHIPVRRTPYKSVSLRERFGSSRMNYLSEKQAPLLKMNEVNEIHCG